MKRIFLFLALAVGMAAKATVVPTVSSVSDLQALATSVNAGDDYSDKTVTLTADLNLSGVSSWTPIGTTDHPFVGTFEGGNHTISNLSVSAVGANTGNVAGLFGKIGSGGTVKDVHVSSGTIQLSSVTASCYSGSIAGINVGTILGCSNAAEVRGNWDNASVGGIAGENDGTIQNCYNLGTVYTGNYSSNLLGGIAGENKGTIGNCFVKATIEKVSAFGAIGKIAANNSGTVTGCFYMNGTAGDVPAVVSLANASDNTLTITSNMGSGKNVLLNGRTLFADGNWNTLCLPFDIPAGATGYSPIAGATVKTLSSSSFSAGTLTLTFADATTIKAGKPYLVKWNTTLDDNDEATTDDDRLTDPVFMNVEVSTGTTNITTTDVDFVGTFNPISYTERTPSVLFLGSGSTLYYPSGEGTTTINAFRAYFRVKALDIEGGGSYVRDFVLNFDEDDEADAIGSIVNGQWSMVNDVWYDLSGRKIGTGKSFPLKGVRGSGLYIVNGKKFVIK